MPSTIDSQKVLSKEKIELLNLIGADLNLNAVKWVSLKDYDTFVAGYLRSVGVGAIDQMDIAAADDAAGTNPVQVKLKTFGASTPDAVGDYAFLEVQASEVEQQAPGKQFVSLRIKLAVATDDGAVMYLNGCAHYPAQDLTSDSIA